MNLLLALALLLQEPPSPPEMPPEVHPQEEPPAPPAPEARDPWIDFSRLELVPQVGAALFGDDFESDPRACFGLLARAPLPILSPQEDVEKQLFGAFLQLTFTTIDRDLDPPPDTTDGSLFFVGAGLDMLLLLDKEVFIRGQFGLRYGQMSAVDDLENGVAILLGAVGGMKVAEKIHVVFNTQIDIADAGDWIWFNQLGVQIRF